ncbi:ATP-binding protein [Candidatus Tisiphia endosymbiont of Beris chalybata]|uniref:ATP-binding protein n=1 Tax=Candidatus Tisiphia endosymbiont of Beris chalybata TaxID=3066262 RepID=UPI00312CB39C
MAFLKKSSNLFAQNFGSLNSATQCQELGLGLICVKQLVQEINGKIELSSEEGKTTTIECKIPVQLPNSTDSE